MNANVDFRIAASTFDPIFWILESGTPAMPTSQITNSLSVAQRPRFNYAHCDSLLNHAEL